MYQIHTTRSKPAPSAVRNIAPTLLRERMFSSMMAFIRQIVKLITIATVYLLSMKIYIKPLCPFCIRLLSLLDESGLKYEVVDVIAHPQKNDEMMKKS